jgi:hypothetical protein
MSETIYVAGCTVTVDRDPFVRATREQPSEGGYAFTDGAWVLEDICELRHQFELMGVDLPSPEMFGLIVGEALPELAQVFFENVFEDEIANELAGVVFEECDE